MLRFFWEIVIVYLLFNLLSPNPTFAQSETPQTPLDFSIEMGDEEYIMGPVNEYIDSPFFTVPIPQGLRAFSANGTTYSFSGSDINHLSKEGISIDKGSSGNFDECGAWLASVYKIDEQHWIGWYHAEERCNYTMGKTHKSVAFAESFDAGKSWVKTGYPNNQVLTSDIFFNDTDQDDEGDMNVIRSGEYFYMFFVKNWTTRIARSTVSDLGKPGTWYKYYNGQFSEPGIGGRSSQSSLTNTGTYVSYNNYLGRYINIVLYGRWGFYFSYTNPNNILSWHQITQPIFPQVSHNEDLRVDYWLPDRQDKLHVYGYPSLISIDGDSGTSGQTFYLYYMKLFPGEEFNQRYQMRRKITLHKPSYLFPALVELNKYTNIQGKTKISIEIAKPSENYAKTSFLGYILPYQENNTVPIYECFSSTLQAYFLSLVDPSLRSWLHCSSDSDTFIRKLGYISKSRTGSFQIPLVQNESIIGFIINLSSPTPTPMITLTFTPTPTILV